MFKAPSKDSKAKEWTPPSHFLERQGNLLAKMTNKYALYYVSSQLKSNNSFDN